MPELPDVSVYVERLAALLRDQPLQGVRLKSPFLLRSVEPPLSELDGKRVLGARRMGKRIVLELEHDLFLVFHLMIAGRFRWRQVGAGLPGKMGLAAFDFPHGTLVLTEAGNKKRASLHVVRGEAALQPFARGGLEVLEATPEQFAAALTRENHTLKRALTDPRLFSGIGNAYSDEVLHRARLSPFKQTDKLSEEQTERLRAAVVSTLTEWTERVRAEVVGELPEKVTAFREGMAVHGRYGQPCPDCGAPVQRIIYAENECNYCVACQTGGRVLADRVLSQLMKDDWPRTLEELEELRGG